MYFIHDENVFFDQVFSCILVVLKIVGFNRNGALGAGQSRDFAESDVWGHRINLQCTTIIKFGVLVDMVILKKFLVGIFHTSIFRPPSGSKFTEISLFSVNFKDVIPVQIFRKWLQRFLCKLKKIILAYRFKKCIDNFFQKTRIFEIY